MGSFGRRLNKIGDIMLANVSKSIREAAMAATREAVLRTPVKTGTARINWILSAATPVRKLLEGPNTPKRETNRQVASAKALIDASNAIKNWKVGSGNIFISNSVHYIGKLDSGSSRQARQGMTKFAVLAAKQKLRKARLLRGR
jgi:hypothetical protein